MEVLESALLAEFIGYINLVSKVRAVVDAAEGGAGAAVWDESFSALLQVLRSKALRGQEVLDAAAVASSARRFLAGFKALEELLQRLAGAAGDLDMLVRVPNRGAATEDDMDVDGDAAARAAATEDDMDVDGRPAPGARHWQEGSGRSCASAGSVAAFFSSPGAKRKRACGGEVDTVRPQKRRRHAWTRSHQWPPSSSGRVSSAQRAPPPRPAALPRSQSRRARSVALAISRIRRRNGKPPPTRNRPQPGPGLGQHFSRITL